MSEKDPGDPTLEQSILNSDSKSDTEGTIDSTLNDSQVHDETRSSTTGSSDVSETLGTNHTQEKDVEDELTQQGEFNRCSPMASDFCPPANKLDHIDKLNWTEQ